MCKFFGEAFGLRVSVCTPTLQKKNGFVVGDTEFLYSSLSGVGAARRDLCSRASGEVLVMLDDDIFISEAIFSELVNVSEGTFIVARVGKHFSTRVFSIRKSDYDKTPGFNAAIRFVFEDGDFVVNATKCGLKCKVISENKFIHLPHRNRTGDKRKYLSWFEHGKMLVKYTQAVYPGIVGFFGFRSLLREPDVFCVKFFSVIYHLMRGVKNEFKPF